MTLLLAGVVRWNGEASRYSAGSHSSGQPMLARRASGKKAESGHTVHFNQDVMSKFSGRASVHLSSCQT